MTEIYFIISVIIIITLFFVRVTVISHILVFIFIGLLGWLCVTEYFLLEKQVEGLLHADALGVLFRNNAPAHCFAHPMR